MHVRFSVGEALDYGFRTFWDNLWLLLLSLLVTAGLYLGLWIAFIFILAFGVFAGSATTIVNFFVWRQISIATFATVPAAFFIAMALGILCFIFLFWGLQAGFIHLMFNLYDKKEVSIGEIFTRFYLAPRLFGAAFLFVFIIAGGLLLLIIPGIYWGIRFSLFPYFIVDQEIGIMDALRKSYAVTEHHEWRMLAVIATLMLLSIIPIIGATLVFFLFPIVFVYIYRSLTAELPIITPAIPI